ncbi:MAG: efflux RND transporter periplasmic adaptor subunit [Alsobacter sp.]
MTRKWRRALPIILVLAVAALVVPVLLERPGSDQPRQSRRRDNGDPVAVLATTARLADVPVYLEGVGTARPANTVVVRPQVDGQLTKILFTEGQSVRKGDLLATIDPTIYQAQLEQAKAKKAQDEAQVENARRDLERYSRLAETNSVTKQQADTQRAQVAQLEALLKADQAAIDNAAAMLAYTRITAPIDGRTGIRTVDEGNLVRASDSAGLVVVSQIQPIAVIFSVPQQELPRINRAIAAGPLKVEAMDNDDREPIDSGTLQVVDNQVDQTTGTVRIKAEFPNAALALWPGAFANVRLLVETLKQVVVVPTGAVQRGPKGPFVFVVGDEDTVSIRLVATTQQDDRRAVIASGLNPGERVVTTGFSRLADGARVTVSAAAEQEPAEGAPALRRVAPPGPEAAPGQRQRGERRSRPDGAPAGAPAASASPTPSQ